MGRCRCRTRNPKGWMRLRCAPKDKCLSHYIQETLNVNIHSIGTVNYAQDLTGGSEPYRAYQDYNKKDCKLESDLLKLLRDDVDTLDFHFEKTGLCASTSTLPDAGKLAS